MADADRDLLVQQFCSMSNASIADATQYLEANEWNLTAASNSYFQEQDEQAGEAAAAPADYTGPRTLDGRPAPAAAASSSKSSSRSTPRPQRRGVAGIATLGSLGSSSNQDDMHDDDSSDDDDHGRGNLFAGGEKSGLAVQDPSQEGGGARKLISDIIAKARANSERPEAADEEVTAPGPAPNRFRGSGMTLGGDGVESRSIPDPLGPSPSTSSAEPQERILHLWQDGFSIDDGELKRFDDPAHQADLEMIRMGRAPLHLMNVQQGQPVDVKVQQHAENYKPQPKKYKPFGGSGQRLGSPVPGAGTSSAASSSAPPPPTSAPSGNATAPNVDTSQPTIMLRIQLPDGTRLPARFNTTNTIGDVYGLVRSASAETATRPWVLATTFPNKDHTDENLVLGEMSEFKKGGTAMVKWV